MTEKIYQINFNWVSNDDYERFVVGINCVEIVEIDRERCRVLCDSRLESTLTDGKLTEVRVELPETQEVSNINRKFFRKDSDVKTN